MGVLDNEIMADPNEGHTIGGGFSQVAANNAGNNVSSSNGLVGGLFNAVTGGAMGHVMGMIFGGAEDNRQYNQQARLDQLQLSNEMQMADFQRKQQLQMWKDTNYPAQIEELKEAGLSPGLIYKQGGDGGQLGAGIPQTQGATAADAAQTTQANAAQIGMGLQLEQMKVMESQANLNNAQAQKLSGVDTENTVQNTKTSAAQAASLTQGINNQKATQDLTKVQTQLTQLETTLKGMTLDDTARIIHNTADKLFGEASSALAQGNIDQETQAQKADIIGQTLTNLQLQAQAIQQGITIDTAKTTEIYNSIKQKWQELNIKQQDIDAKNRAITEYTKTMLISAGINAAGNVINNVIDIATRRPQQTGHTTTPINGERDETGNYIPGGSNTKYNW